MSDSLIRFVAVAVIAVAGTISVLGFPQDDTVFYGVKRDVFSDTQTAQAALSGSEGPLNPRTPAASLLTVPLLAIPDGYLVWGSVAVNVAAAVALVAGLFKFTSDPTSRLVMAFGVPLSSFFAETVVHTNTWVVYAAALVWGWYFIESRADVPAGILVGVVAAARLWPFGLLFLFIRWKRWNLVKSTVATAVVVNIAGLALPGVTVRGSVESLVGGASEWLASTPNLSFAGIIEGWVPAPVYVGFLAAAVIWVVFIGRVKTVRGQIGLTVAASMFASPLMWAGYLLALTPLIADRKLVWLAAVNWFPPLLPVVVYVSQNSISARKVHDENPVMVTRQ